jgi:hypothetical protein
MSQQDLSSVANTSISESDSSQDQQQQSIIFAPAFKKMVSYLKSKGISANAINRSATPDGRTARADITDFINHKTIWKINKLENFLLCDVVSKDPEALEIFFKEVTDLLKQNQEKIEDEEHTVENSADIEDVVLGGSFHIRQRVKHHYKRSMGHKLAQTRQMTVSIRTTAEPTNNSSLAIR